MKWHWIIPVILIPLILNADGYVILTPISVGTNPDGVFLNLDTNRAYVPNIIQVTNSCFVTENS